MKKKQTSSTVFHVVNSNVQILPNARQAVLNIYGFRPDELNVSSPVSPLFESVPDVSPLLSYISKKEDLDGYLVQLASCTTASDLARVIVGMMKREPSVTSDMIVKQRFISMLLPFAPRLIHGKSVDNIRCRVNDLLARHSKR